MHFCKAIDILFPTDIERSYANAFYISITYRYQQKHCFFNALKLLCHHILAT